MPLPLSSKKQQQSIGHIMIPGLEYEQPTNVDPTSSTYGGSSSPSAQSINTVEMSPHQQTYNNNDSYHMQQLHRRRPHNNGNGYTSPSSFYNNNSYNNGGGGGSLYEEDKYNKVKTPLRKLDFFPKTDREMTVRTERGGQLTAVGYCIMIILILAEYVTWRNMNGESLEHIVVDTR